MFILLLHVFSCKILLKELQILMPKVCVWGGSLTKLIKMCLGTILFQNWTHHASLQESGPLVYQTALSTHIILNRGFEMT